MIVSLFIQAHAYDVVRLTFVKILYFILQILHHIVQFYIFPN